ncbi:MAG: hypothetical protein IPP03_05095 [Dechloromonas sp.]|nr:hypothetical protein [Candidatus Dechloromonas phosphoritropha]
MTAPIAVGMAEAAESLAPALDTRRLRRLGRATVAVCLLGRLKLIRL